MATAGEVTVSLAEVVMVKAEDCDPDDPNKTQVILQLQPIPTGEESAETDAAVMTVEAHEEQTDGDDVEIGCPITCGDCKALLLVKKFVCPGINVKCVKAAALFEVSEGDGSESAEPEPPPSWRSATRTELDGFCTVSNAADRSKKDDDERGRLLLAVLQFLQRRRQRRAASVLVE
ncbi:glucocorticoid modulatory element-binding protein 1-like [Notothenia coriiceps]|uniref:Glucocorticoid modulatory element-binding protein 1-like n=1 Tax=Notothenia coriiceps TaxID=8208 RepID=A0A6I9Q4H1_9TELE|nr:PREDICTED: glucocorticoid modulatory element-binding protein 1-like [Notothenia coriiceps]